ncbi:MAG: AAA family ATPase [Acidobacteriota bacterium]
MPWDDLQPIGVAAAEPRRSRLEPPVRPVGVLLADVKPEAVRWLWPGHVPLGKLTVIDGDPGLGKSTLALDLAARVSTGASMPDGTPGARGGVVLLTAEDGLADTVRPRLEAHGADLSRIVALPYVGNGDDRRPLTLPDDLITVRAAISRVGAALVVIDPLMAVLGSRTDAHRDQDTRRALAPIAALAEETGAAIVIVRHLNKSAGGNPLYRGGGSIGIIGAARAGFLVARDPEAGERRVLASIKSNLCRPAPSLAFVLDEVGDVPRVRWLGPTKQTADALLAAAVSPAARPRDEAVAFLRQLLADGPVPALEVCRQADEVGISRKTLKRAKATLGVISRKLGAPGGDRQAWSWELPKGVDSGEEGQQETVDPFGDSDPLLSEEEVTI